MKDKIHEQWVECCEVSLQNEAFYNAIAASLGMSGSSFWIMYSICTSETPLTQKDICTLWGMRKQTVNTALSKLLGSGLIELSESDTDKRSKIITLTQLGSDFSEREVQRVIDLEMRALRRMTADEREAMLSTSKRFLELMRLESAADTGGF